MANQSLDRIVNFYDIRNKLKLEINPFGMKKRNLDWNEVWFFNIIGSIWYMISRNLSLIIDWQFCWSQNASEILWSSKDGQFQTFKYWKVEYSCKNYSKKNVIIMNWLYLIIFKVNKSLDFPIYLGSVCFYANEGSVDISIFL